MSSSPDKKLAAVVQAEQELLLSTYERYPLLIEKGQGVYLYDSSGKKYLDFLSGIGVNALGYGHKRIVKTIAQQSERAIHLSNLFYHEFQAELAKRLTKASGLDRAFFSNSGTEAWEGALKIARAYARQQCGGEGKCKFLSMENSFHGRTFGSVTMTHTPKYREPFTPLLPGVEFVRFNDVADLKAKFHDGICALGLETIQGEGGIRPVTAEFLKTARHLCDKHGALLLVDEIQCGLGRTGKYFAYQHYGLTPDIVTVAKPLAAGLPLGAILVSERVSRCIKPGMHGTTFGGGPLACATAVAFMDTLEEDKLLKRAEKVGHYFLNKLQALKKKHAAIQEVRGLGLMIGIELDSPELAKAMVKALMECGVIINRTHETVLRFLPPYIIEKKHVDQVVKALDERFQEKSVEKTAA